jgi:membrane associated rhomboid family serine protease
MIPISDENPTLHKPYMTWALLAAMFAVWLAVEGAGMDQLGLAASICDYGMVPGELTHRAPLGTSVPIARGLECIVDDNPINRFTPLTSMFLHGGWGHILGNALFFWVFGNNIEDSMGAGRFLVFYIIHPRRLLGAVPACPGQHAVHFHLPDSGDSRSRVDGADLVVRGAGDHGSSRAFNRAS